MQITTGLVNAAQQYTRKEGATFATYASIRVRGASLILLKIQICAAQQFRLKI